jgi:hypothetical protein
MFERFKAMFARKPPPKMQHPVLGELQFGDMLWEGKVDFPGRRLEVAIVGTEQGPDADMLAALLGRLERLGELEQQVVSFLTSRLHDVPKTDAADFTMTSVDFLWKGDPGHFMVGLALKGDEYALWRIEFVHGDPAFLGRDD